MFEEINWPALLFLTNSIDKYQTNRLSIPEDLRLILKAYVAILNGCEFCSNLALANALKLKIGKDKFLQLYRWEESKNIFSEKEQAVLQFASEYSDNRKISEDCFKRLQKSFNEIEIIDIITQNAIENYFNALNIPLEIGSDELVRV